MLLTYSPSEIKKEVKMIKAQSFRTKSTELAGSNQLASALKSNETQAIRKVFYSTSDVSPAGYWS